MAADPVAVGNAFVTHYNSLFDSPDRTSLAPLYVRAICLFARHCCVAAPRGGRPPRSTPRAAWPMCAQQDSSMLTYEGKQIQGQAAIINEYANPASGHPFPCPSAAIFVSAAALKAAT